MSQPSFVHLRLHSEFSIVDGIVRIEEAVERAAADGMGALALTDLANAFGMVKFYRSAREAGIKPIVGCDVWVTNEADRDKPHRLLLLVRSSAGYHRLSELLDRLPNVELTGPVRRIRTNFLGAIKSMPVRCGKAA